MIDEDELRPAADTPSTYGDLLRRFRSLNVWLLASITLILAAWALRATASIVIPVVASLFIALAVHPIDYRLREAMPKGLRWVGHVVAMLVVLLVLVGFFAGVFFAARQAADEMPRLVDEIQAVLPETAALGPADGATPANGAEATAGDAGLPAGGEAAVPAAEGAGGAAGAGAETDGSMREMLAGIGVTPEALISRIASGAPEAISGFVQSLLGAALHTLAALTLIFFLVLLMLIEAPRWRAKTIDVLSTRDQHDWEDVTAVVAYNFRWFLLVRTGIGVVTATLYATWLGVLGIDLLLTWWVLAWLLNYIPTVGSIISGVLPALYAFVTADVGTAVVVAAGLLVIEQVMGNFVDPWVQGKQLSLSPLVTFFALLFWAWLWGVAGALLAVPLLMLIVIVCAHVPAVMPTALFLSDCADMESLEQMTRRRDE